MIWQVPKIWNGGDVWILGGGPSVTEQFEIPENVVKEVKAGLSPPSIYSNYMGFLHDKHVIGINVAYLIGDWIDIVFFGDNPFYLEHQKGLRNFPNLVVSCASNISNVDWIKYTPTDGNNPRGISPYQSKVSWNQNSGSAAISLAVHLGAKRIFLLGFDMKRVDNSQHWHTLYKQKRENPRKRNPASGPFERHLRGFPQIDRDAKQLGVKIYNVCPDSAIKEFPKLTLKQAQCI